MEGVIRQLYDYDGSNLFPRTRPDAFVSSLQDSDNTGIETIGELIDSSTPGTYIQDGETIDYEPEFVYRIPVSDCEALGGTDASGTLKAVKLTQVAALHFNAILSHDFTVANEVGDATLGKVYTAGTLLEDIIIDMLSGGSIYDVGRVLPGAEFMVSYTSDGTTYTSIAPNSVIAINAGDTIKVKYQFTFLDGKYIPVTGYTLEQFQANNDIAENAGYYNDLGVDSYLAAGCSPTSLTLTRKNAPTPIDTHTNPTSGSEYGPVELERSAVGDKIYVISVDYSAGVSSPHKSNNALSDKIPAGTCANKFTFTVRGVQVQVYDVYGRSPRDLGGTATGFSFGQRLVAKNQYDISNGTNTGLWTDDNLVIGLTKYFDNTVTPYDEIHHDTNGDDTSVYGPVFSNLIAGRFYPNSGYPADTFSDYNSHIGVSADPDYVPAGCNYTSPVIIGLYRQGSSSPIASKTIAYNGTTGKTVTKNIDAKSPNIAQDQGVNLTLAYYVALEYYGDCLINAQNITTAGKYRLKATLPYTASTVHAKKSDNTDSSVSITANAIELTSNDIDILEEIDVNKSTPAIEILDISIAGTAYHNGDTVSYGAYDANKNAIVRFQYTDGNYRSSNTTKYTNDQFNTNNPGATNGVLDAGCDPSGNFYLYLDSANTGNYTTVESQIATIPYSLTNIGTGRKEFTVGGNYTDAQNTPKKKSTRNSSNVINASSVLSAGFVLNFSGAQTRTLTAIADPSNGGKVQINSGVPNTTVSADIMPGSSVTLTASANNGFAFTKWQSSNTSIGESTSNPWVITMPNGNATVNAIFSQPTDNYHFVMVTTNDTNVNSTTYNTVDELFSQAHLAQSHFDITQNTIPNPYVNNSTYNGVGANAKVLVIAAPVEYKSAKIYVNGTDQMLTFTLVPTANSMNGIPYTTGGDVKYRLFKYRSLYTTGFNINKVELSQ